MLPLRRVPHGGLGTSVPFACLLSLVVGSYSQGPEFVSPIASGQGGEKETSFGLLSTYYMLDTDS